MNHNLKGTLGLIMAVGLTATRILAEITIVYVTVGNPNNAPDSRIMIDGTSGYGFVPYEFKIAKNEISIAQYCEFLNSVARTDPYSLYSTNMSSQAFIAGISRDGTNGSYSYSVMAGSGNRPITNVSWFDAARFCNWVHNGQGACDTETGAYSLNGATSGIYTKNAGATTWIPSENEWYKAAYYDPTNGGSGGYWEYPTRSNSLAGNTIGSPLAANYYAGNYVSSPNRLTDVGAYGVNSQSYYGTNDQGGNVWEWNDGVISGPSRGRRGGSWASDGVDMSSTGRIGGGDGGTTFQSFGVGFRVASIAQPSSAAVDFRITAISISSDGGKVQLSWKSEPSATYSIESSPDLTTPSWTEVATGIQSQGSSTTRTLDITPSPRRFFRVAHRP